MAKYTNVEKPLLEKLHQAHSLDIGHGQGIPVDTEKLYGLICWVRKNGRVKLVEVN